MHMYINFIDQLLQIKRTSLPLKYKSISSVVTNTQDITLIEVKETTLLKDCERLERKKDVKRVRKTTVDGG